MCEQAFDQPRVLLGRLGVARHKAQRGVVAGHVVRVLDADRQAVEQSDGAAHAGELVVELASALEGLVEKDVKAAVEQLVRHGGALAERSDELQGRALARGHHATQHAGVSFIGQGPVAWRDEGHSRDDMAHVDDLFQLGQQLGRETPLGGDGGLEAGGASSRDLAPGLGRHNRFFDGVLHERYVRRKQMLCYAVVV